MSIRVKSLGSQSYAQCLQQMKDYTLARTAESEDQIWWLEHQPVFTQGQAGKPEHLLQLGDIPLVQSDRGGQVTYHGPGQLIVYLLLDLKRHGLGVRSLVDLIEQTTIRLLASYDIQAYAKPEAPGIYVSEAKIASLGLRVKRGCSYHGLGLNVDCDLAPFSRINPCGYSGQKMTSMQQILVDKTPSMAQVAEQWLALAMNQLGGESD